MTRFTPVLLALLLAACEPASQSSTVQPSAVPSGPSVTAANGMWVVMNPAKPGEFEVLQQVRAGPNDFWCAAGDFVDRKLGMPPNTRVYVARPRGPSQLRPGRTAVGFTYQPSQEILDAAAAGQGISESITNVGYNLRAAHGQSGCRDSRKKLRSFGPWG